MIQNLIKDDIKFETSFDKRKGTISFVAGNSGSGKSFFAKELAIKYILNNYSVGVISLGSKINISDYKKFIECFNGTFRLFDIEQSINFQDFAKDETTFIDRSGLLKVIESIHSNAKEKFKDFGFSFCVSFKLSTAKDFSILKPNQKRLIIIDEVWNLTYPEKLLKLFILAKMQKTDVLLISQDFQTIFESQLAPLANQLDYIYAFQSKLINDEEFAKALHFTTDEIKKIKELKIERDSFAEVLIKTRDQFEEVTGGAGWSE